MLTLPKHGALLPEHQVADLLAPNLKIVFCGTALGRASAQQQAYYAHPGNFFWRTLHRIGLTPTQLRPEEYRQLLNFGIGLTDICKQHFGNDSELPPHAFDRETLHQKILHYQPRILAFTSKTAAAAYLGCTTDGLALGMQHPASGPTRIAVLPSPSGQARRFWNQDAWQSVADAAHAM